MHNAPVGSLGLYRQLSTEPQVTRMYAATSARISALVQSSLRRLRYTPAKLTKGIASINAHNKRPPDPCNYLMTENEDYSTSLNQSKNARYGNPSRPSEEEAVYTSMYSACPSQLPLLFRTRTTPGRPVNLKKKLI